MPVPDLSDVGRRMTVALWVAVTSLCASDAAWADPPLGVWEGAATCSDGERFFRMSIEPGDRAQRLVLDVLDTPGGLWSARRIGPLNPHPSDPTLFSGGGSEWVLRPLAEPAVPYPGDSYTMSADGLEITSKPFGGDAFHDDCEGAEFTRLPAAAATGGIETAMDLPGRFVGQIGCNGFQPTNAIELTLTGIGERDVEGVLIFSQHPAGTPTDGGVFAVFGTFEPETGTLTLIGDRWIEQRYHGDSMFDFQAVLRDGGRRLIGRNDWRQCGLIDLTIPGAEPAAQIVRPTPPRPVLEWDDPAACVTLLDWAAPAAAEIDGASFYTDVMVSTTREVGVGLFADERFVPFFGKPFDEFSEEEKKHVAELSRYCERLTTSMTPMRHSGVTSFVADFFWPAGWPELELTVPRIRLLQARLVREMAELEGRTVGEGDIEALIGEQEQVEERYRGLWRSDLVAMRGLLDSKIEAARGELAARLEADILALPDDWSAFQREQDIQADILRLGDQSTEEQTWLRELLAKRLSKVADSMLLTLSGDLSGLEPTLAGLWQLTDEINTIWPDIEAHLPPTGPGLLAIKDLTGSMAQAAYPEFEARVNRLMAQAGDFAEREMLYRDVVALYQRTLPYAEELSGGFEAYTALVSRLAPVPTLEDLVEEDGSPTSLGLKLALTDFIGTWYDTQSAIPPYSLAFMTQTIRVASVSKRGCVAAEQGGYWCEYGLRVEGDFPFLGLLSRIPYEARFEFDGTSWWVVETPNQ